MWGTSPLIPTKQAFSFLLSCFSSPLAKLLVSLCSFLLCRLIFRLTQAVCFAEQGAP